jgi:hypothetical protein
MVIALEQNPVTGIEGTLAHSIFSPFLSLHRTEMRTGERLCGELGVRPQRERRRHHREPLHRRPDRVDLAAHR